MAEKRGTGFTIFVIVFIIFVIAWNTFLLPRFVENVRINKQAETSCNVFCSGINGAEHFTFKKNRDKGSFECFCRNPADTVLGKTAYPLG